MSERGSNAGSKSRQLDIPLLNVSEAATIGDLTVRQFVDLMEYVIREVGARRQADPEAISAAFERVGDLIARHQTPPGVGAAVEEVQKRIIENLPTMLRNAPKDGGVMTLPKG